MTITMNLTLGFRNTLLALLNLSKESGDDQVSNKYLYIYIYMLCIYIYIRVWIRLLECPN